MSIIWHPTGTFGHPAADLAACSGRPASAENNIGRAAAYASGARCIRMAAARCPRGCTASRRASRARWARSCSKCELGSASLCRKYSRSAGRRPELAARGAFEWRRRAVLGDVRRLGRLLVDGEHDVEENGVDLLVLVWRLQRHYVVCESDLPRLQSTLAGVKKKTANAQRALL